MKLTKIIPKVKYDNMPCVYVAVGTAYEQINGTDFADPLPAELRGDGYATLNVANKYIRQHLTVKKRQDFRRGERPLLGEFLKDNTEKCVICVLGHFIYAEESKYWSFFDNDTDEVVAVWYLKSDDK